MPANPPVGPCLCGDPACPRCFADELYEELTRADEQPLPADLPDWWDASR